MLASLKDVTFQEVQAFFARELLAFEDTKITVLSVTFFIAVIALCLTVLRLNDYIFHRLENKADENEAASLYVFQRFSHYVIITVSMFLGLTTLGVDLSHLALLATGLSVGIGFGLQSIFNNFFSGIIILLEKSLKVGDFIELDNGTAGTVQEINIRSTLVRTRNNIDILVPNSEFVNGRVVNWTLGDSFCRFQVPFGVAYGSDKDLVKKAVLEAAKRNPLTIYGPKRDPDVWLKNFGDSSLDFELIVWVDTRKNKKPGGVEAGYMWEIESSFREHDIEIPFPQRDLHIKSE